jgi:hypothetical protein
MPEINGFEESHKNRDLWPTSCSYWWFLSLEKSFLGAPSRSLKDIMKQNFNAVGYFSSFICTFNVFEIKVREARQHSMAHCWVQKHAVLFFEFIGSPSMANQVALTKSVSCYELGTPNLSVGKEGERMPRGAEWTWAPASLENGKSSTPLDWER